ARGLVAVGPVLAELPGAQAQHKNTTMAVTPVSIKSEPVADFVKRLKDQQGEEQVSSSLYSVSSLEGSDLANGQLPDATLAADPQRPGRKMGRLLTSADRGTMNVLGGEELLAPPWNLRPGDT